MVIAVNTGFILQSQAAAHGNFIYRCFVEIARHQAENTFIFISEGGFQSSLLLPQNAIPVVVSPKPGLLKNFWLKRKISTALKKYKADIFITDTQLFIFTLKIPQYLIAPHALAAKFKKCFIKAKIVWADAAFLKEQVIKNYGIDAGKIKVVYSAADDNFKPLHFEERENIKEQYSGGKEYFLSTGSISSKAELVSLLKAFSVFKKRQKSAMQLLIAANSAFGNEEIEDQLRLYKYKDDVKVLKITQPEKMVKIIASAYAAVCPFYGAATYLPVLQIMQCEVPVITNKSGALPEVCADAVLYAAAPEHTDLADKMMLLFKDENLRRQLIEKGKALTLKYTLAKTAAMLWECIVKNC